MQHPLSIITSELLSYESAGKVLIILKVRFTDTHVNTAPSLQTVAEVNDNSV